LWASAPSSIASEALAQCGVEYVCCDNQHGLIDYQVTVSMIQGILLGGSNPIVRVPWNEPGIAGKMLDAGSQGVIVPMVNTPEEAQAAVSACRYPPLGNRSFGPAAAGPRMRKYYESTPEQVAVIVMVETVQALGNVDAIVATPGVDAVYVGPADLSISMGLPPGNNDDSPDFVSALETIVAACRNAGVVPGIHSSGSLTPRRLEMGFKMITVSADLVAMRVGVDVELAKARSGNSAPSDKMY
jgi:4-hydroxy-2-oxoheptanedioate aldolase